jgi:hypothetical protein
MASTAFSAQGSTIKFGATAAAKNITAITKANPAVITSTAHGLSNGTVVLFASVTGMTEINGRTAVVKVIDANTFYAYGVNSTNFSTYTSGGTATPTQTTLGNVRSFNVGGGQKAQVDVTNLASTAKEFIGGLADDGTMQCEMDFNDADAGQQVLIGGKAASGVLLACEIGFADGQSSKASFNAEVFSFDFSGGVDDAVRATASLKLTGGITYS